MTPEMMIQFLQRLRKQTKFRHDRFIDCAVAGEASLITDAEDAAEHIEALDQALALLSAGTWQPIDAEAKDGRPLLVALIKDGRIWRVSDAKHNGLGFYTINGGAACHWATHSMPLPAPPSDGDQR